jgi:hypothetical protein
LRCRSALGRLPEFSWWEKEYGEITEAEMDEAEAEHREIERLHAELARAREAAAESAPEPHRDAA